MSAPGKILNPFATLVITGNPGLDAKIRYAMFGAFCGIVGSVGGWLNAKGFHDPLIYTVYLPTAVAAALSAGVLAAWGIIRASRWEAIVQLREALGVQAGINIALSPEPTPVLVTIAEAQRVIADHAPDASNIEKK